MKRALVLCCLLSFTFLFLLQDSTLAGCGDTQNARSPAETDSWTCHGFSSGQITKVLHWRISWVDNTSRDVDITDYGQTMPNGYLEVVPIVPGVGRDLIPRISRNLAPSRIGFKRLTLRITTVKQEFVSRTFCPHVITVKPMRANAG